MIINKQLFKHIVKTRFNNPYVELFEANVVMHLVFYLKGDMTQPYTDAEFIKLGKSKAHFSSMTKTTGRVECLSILNLPKSHIVYRKSVENMSGREFRDTTKDDLWFKHQAEIKKYFTDKFNGWLEEIKNEELDHRADDKSLAQP